MDCFAGKSESKAVYSQNPIQHQTEVNKIRKSDFIHIEKEEIKLFLFIDEWFSILKTLKSYETDTGTHKWSYQATRYMVNIKKSVEFYIVKVSD